MKRILSVIIILCIIAGFLPTEGLTRAETEQGEYYPLPMPESCINCFESINTDALLTGSDTELAKYRQSLGLCDFSYPQGSDRSDSYWWNKLPDNAVISETDIRIMQIFLEQRLPSGKTNGEMLCKSAYDKNNPRTWVGTIWYRSEADNEYHITTIVTDPGVLLNTFGVNAGPGYELGGTFDMRGMPMLTALWCGNCGQFDEIMLSDIESLSTVNFPGMKLEGRLHIDGCSLLHAVDFSKSDLLSLDLSDYTVLVGITCKNNPALTELILPDSSTLEQVYCSDTALCSLDVSGLGNLKVLEINDTGIINPDLSHNTRLASLWCDNTRMDVLDLSACTDLSLLMCINCGIRKLVLPKSSEYAQIIECDNNYLTELDTSGNSTLVLLTCDNNLLTELDLSDNIMLKQLHCRDNYLTELDMSANPYLETLRTDNNRIAKLSLNNNSASLWRFTCSHNLLCELDVDQCLNLTEFDCSYNAITSLDLTGQRSYDPYDEVYLRNFSYEGNPIVDIKNAPYKNSSGEHTNVSLSAAGGGYVYIGIEKDDTNYKTVYAQAVCAGGEFTGWYDGDTLISGDVIIKLYDTEYTNLTASFTGETTPFTPAEQSTFPDKTFYDLTLSETMVNSTDEGNIRAFFEQTDASGVKNGEKLCKSYDANNPASWDCVAWYEESSESRVFGLYFNSCDYAGNCIQNDRKLAGKLNMTGSTALHNVICTEQDVEAADFTGCTSLALCDLSGCKTAQSVKLGSCGNLLYLNTENTAIGDVDVGACPSLLTLNAGNSGCKALNLAGNEKLHNLRCNNNGITQLDLNGLSALQYLNCSENKLKTLDTSPCTNLLCLHVSDNELTELALVSGSLQSLLCSGNSLRKAELPKCRLYVLDVSDNEITEIKNVDANHTPDLLFFSAASNRLTDISLEKLTLLLHVDCSDNDLTRLSLTGCLQLACLRCGKNKLTELVLPDTGMDIHFLFELDCSENNVRELDLTCVSENLHTLNISGNPVVSVKNAPLGYVLRQPIELTDSRFYRINILAQGNGTLDYDLDTITAIGDDFVGFYKDYTKLTAEKTLRTDDLESCTIIAQFGAHSIGDCNMDGKVNTGDAVVVLKHSAEMMQLTDEQKALADCNHDGNVNTGDAVLILKYAAGMIAEL